jgi:pimeloyl-ACP methyl ester carboxylesterase
MVIAGWVGRLCRYFCVQTAVILCLGIAAASGSTSLEPAYPDLKPCGPASAKGVVVYSHGRSLVGEDSASPAPEYLRYLAAAGFDVLRFNRPSAEDSLRASSVDLARRVEALKAEGYRRIILSGQSFGAFLSIMAAAETESVAGVIATAPAAFGSRLDSKDTWRMNASELYRRLAQLHHARVLLTFFQDDIYDPGGRSDTAADLLSRSGNYGIVIDRPAGFSGHLAAAGPAFAKRFGPCLEAFAEGSSPACGDGRIVQPEPEPGSAQPEAANQQMTALTAQPTGGGNDR